MNHLILTIYLVKRICYEGVVTVLVNSRTTRKYLRDWEPCNIIDRKANAVAFVDYVPQEFLSCLVSSCLQPCPKIICTLPQIISFRPSSVATKTAIISKRPFSNIGPRSAAISQPLQTAVKTPIEI